MIEYKKRPVNMVRSMSNKVLLGCRKVCLHLSLKNNSKGLILNLQNVYYLPNNLCNLVSLRLLYNSKIYYNNKQKIWYHIKFEKVLA